MNRESKYQKLLTDTSIRKRHVKLYKVGKKWVAMGIIVAAFGIVGVSTTASAATEASANEINTANQNDSQNPLQSKAVNLTATTKPAQPANQGEEPSGNDNQPAQVAAEQKTAPSGTTGGDSLNEPTKTPSVTDENDQSAKVTALGDATAADIEVAKKQATAAYKQTGQAQVITAVSDEQAPASEVIQQQADVALQKVDESIKQAMADNDITLDKVTHSGNYYTYFGSTPWVENVRYTDLANRVQSFEDRKVGSIVAETQVLTDPTQALQKLSDAGIHVSVLIQTKFTSEQLFNTDYDYKTTLINNGDGYSGQVITSRPYAMADRATQTITFKNDSAGGDVLNIRVTSELKDATQMVNDEIASLEAQGYILVSNNYQEPDTIMTSEQALSIIEEKLKTDIDQYNDANGTDYQFAFDYVGAYESGNTPEVEHRLMLSSEKLGHDAWDEDVSNYVNQTFGYNPDLEDASIDMNDTIDGLTSDGDEVRFVFSEGSSSDGNEVFHERFDRLKEEAIYHQIHDDTIALSNMLSNDSSLSAAFEVLRANNQSVSVSAAPTYVDTTLTYTAGDLEWDPETQSNKLNNPVQRTVTIKGLTNDSLKVLFMGSGVKTGGVPADTNFEVHFVQAALSSDSPQIRTEIPEGLSVTHDDYYNYTASGTPGDGIQVKTEIPEGLSVTHDDYYDYTAPGTPGAGIQVKTEIPEGLSVTHDDYYDYTAPGTPGDGIQVKTEIPDGVSVTPDHYYNHLVPEGPSVTPEQDNDTIPTPPVTNEPETPETQPLTEGPAEKGTGTVGDNTATEVEHMSVEYLNDQNSVQTTSNQSSNTQIIDQQGSQQLPQTSETTSSKGATLLGLSALLSEIGLLIMGKSRKKRHLN